MDTRKIDEIRYQRKEGKREGEGDQEEVDEDKADARIVQEQINKIYKNCGDEEQGRADTLCQDAIKAALRSKRQRWGPKGGQLGWKETQRTIKRTDSTIEKEKRKLENQNREGMELSNQFEALAVEENEIEEVFQAEEKAYGDFKAMVTERNLKCRYTRRALAKRAMEEAKRKQDDVLQINEMCKAIEEEERLADEEEAKAKRKGEEEGEWEEFSEEDEEEEEGDSEGDDEAEEEDDGMDTTTGKTNNRPRGEQKRKKDKTEK